jgi:hypothetical protein
MKRGSKMFKRENTTFLKRPLLLTLLLSCTQPAAPLPLANNELQKEGSQEQNPPSSSPGGTSEATSQTGRESGETMVEPTVITGAFLACDFQPPPAPGATTAQLGCRMADNNTGVKHDMSQHPQYAWGYEPLETGITATVTLATSPDDPWHVYYDIASRFGTLDRVSDLLKVGLKAKDGSATYYQTVGSVTGKLGLLLNGTWASPCSQRRAGDAYTTGKATYSNGNTVVVSFNYSSDANCTSVQMTTEITMALVKTIYNGTGFAIDLKYVSSKVTPRDAQSLADYRQMCPNQTFQLNVTTDITSCDPRFGGLMEYTSMKLNDKIQPQTYSTARSSGANTGSSPELRRTDFSSSDLFVKQ